MNSEKDFDRMKKQSDAGMSPEDAMVEFDFAEEYITAYRDEVSEVRSDVDDENVFAEMVEEKYENEDEPVLEDAVLVEEISPAEYAVNEENPRMSAEIGDTIVIREEDADQFAENLDSSEKTAAEEVPGDSKSVINDDLVAEFAPAPISIPKYNKEREHKKAVKAGEKNRKSTREKNKKRKQRKLLRKIVAVARAICLTVLFVSVLTMSLYTAVVKMNTTKYSVETAIRENKPETFTVGKIKAPEKINLKPSSPSAALADVIRDNSDISITYEDISRGVKRSNISSFLAKISCGIIEHCLYGKEYKEVTKEELKELIYSESNNIYSLTGRHVGESASEEIAAYVMESPEFKELSAENIKRQATKNDTKFTSVVFSTPVLIAMVVIAIILIILILLTCKGYAHSIIGWSTVVCGMAVGIAGYFTSSLIDIRSEFFSDVANALVERFNQSSVIWGAVTAGLGIVVILIGRALREEEYYSEDGGYIVEMIEQPAEVQ